MWEVSWCGSEYSKDLINSGGILIIRGWRPIAFQKKADLNCSGGGRFLLVIIIISSCHHIIISSYHHIIISSYHYIIISSYHHLIISPSHHFRKTGKVWKNIEKSIIHLKNLRISCWVPGGQLNQGNPEFQRNDIFRYVVRLAGRFSENWQSIKKMSKNRSYTLKILEFHVESPEGN